LNGNAYEKYERLTETIVALRDRTLGGVQLAVAGQILRKLSKDSRSLLAVFLAWSELRGMPGQREAIIGPMIKDVDFDADILSIVEASLKYEEFLSMLLEHSEKLREAFIDLMFQESEYRREKARAYTLQYLERSPLGIKSQVLDMLWNGLFSRYGYVADGKMAAGIESLYMLDPHWVQGKVSSLNRERGEDEQSRAKRRVAVFIDSLIVDLKTGAQLKPTGLETERSV